MACPEKQQSRITSRARAGCHRRGVGRRQPYLAAQRKLADARPLERRAADRIGEALVARLGLPALGVLVFLAVLVTWVACWVFRSDARTERVSRVLLAWRGIRGSSNNGTASGDSGLRTAGLPPPAVRMAVTVRPVGPVESSATSSTSMARRRGFFLRAVDAADVGELLVAFHGGHL